MTTHITPPADPSLARIAEDVNATLALFERLRHAKTDIAELRRTRCHLTAGIMRDELLSQLEHWLDPVGMEYRTTLHAIQSRAALDLALATDPDCGF